jgi:hypothetical protein
VRRLSLATKLVPRGVDVSADELLDVFFQKEDGGADLDRGRQILLVARRAGFGPVVVTAATQAEAAQTLSEGEQGGRGGELVHW